MGNVYKYIAFIFLSIKIWCSLNKCRSWILVLKVLRGILGGVGGGSVFVMSVVKSVGFIRVTLRARLFCARNAGKKKIRFLISPFL